MTPFINKRMGFQTHVVPLELKNGPFLQGGNVWFEDRRACLQTNGVLFEFQNMPPFCKGNVTHC